MKNLNIFVTSLLLCLCGMVGCMDKDPEIPVDELFRVTPIVEVEDSETFTVNGVSFTMVAVKGGTFTMGGTSEQGDDVYYGELPTHDVTLSDYSIGQTEVTQALWEAVMGYNPSNIKGDDFPVEMINWEDCQKFVQRLNQLTGKTFRLPTSAEWEYAARGGCKSKGYKYSGSNTIEEVAWFLDNSQSKTHPVAAKQPNELGLYDMSGNVEESCLDWKEDYSSEAQTNPVGLYSGRYRVSRGGSWNDKAKECRVSSFYGCFPEDKVTNRGLRLVLSSIDPVAEMEAKYVKTFTVNGVSFKMISVEGGTFTMGATSEQGDDAESNEKPTHQVTLSDYYIGQTEVTQALWEAVMGYNPSNFVGSDLPVEMVSWSDCQVFVKKLSELTGKTFRLPTEAEWEYAARGGNKSNGYKYSGMGNYVFINEVAWYEKNSSKKTHSVASLRPNELGIYDMSGNVREWCQDGFTSYSYSAQTNPVAPFSDSDRVIRGGSWWSSLSNCRVSYRSGSAYYTTSYSAGLRVVLDNVETYTVNGVSFKMVKVKGGTFKQGSDASDNNEKPAHNVTLSDYSIGQTEVTQALWKAVMGSNPSYFVGDDLPVEKVSWNDCQEFVQKLNQLTGKTFRLPTEAEWEYAARGGNKSKGYKYSGSNTIDEVAWYADNSPSKTHPVATKQPNELELYDMSGNVWELCQDWYGNYSSDAQTNPVGPSSGSLRVSRGGCWGIHEWYSRVSSRTSDRPEESDKRLGLRLVLSQ